MNQAVFGPVQIGQLLKARPPALQIVIIQVRLGGDRLQGTERPGQRAPTLVAIDLNGVVRGRGGITVGLSNPGLDKVIHVHTVGGGMSQTWPKWELQLRLYVLPWQKTIGPIRVLDR